VYQCAPGIPIHWIEAKDFVDNAKLDHFFHQCPIVVVGENCNTDAVGREARYLRMET
jgi:kynurenine formamidase